MALGKEKPELLADWDDATFTTAPPDDVKPATDEEIAALLAADPWELVEAEPEAMPDTFPAGRFKNESGKLYCGRELKLDDFEEWFDAQYLGSLPYNGVMVHHTYRPSQANKVSLQSVHNIFNYYRTQLGWPGGKGPHLWLDPHRDVLYVGTHPCHNGIGCSYRNDRWLHIEAIWNGDAAPFSGHMMDAYAEVLRVVCGERGIPLKHTTWNNHRGINSPSKPHDGYLFHRFAGTNRKSCPGSKVDAVDFRAGLEKRSGSRPPEPDAAWINLAYHPDDEEARDHARRGAKALKAVGLPAASTPRYHKAMRDAAGQQGVHTLVVGVMAAEAGKVTALRLKEKMDHVGAIRGAREDAGYPLEDVMRWRIAGYCEAFGKDAARALAAYEGKA